MTHAYDNPDLSDLDFLLAVRRDPSVPLVLRLLPSGSCRISTMLLLLCESIQPSCLNTMCYNDTHEHTMRSG